jgi:molybdopterin converting factor small subunit
MEIKLIAFGITKQILGNRSIQYTLEAPYTVDHLLRSLEKTYPQLAGLSSLRVAVNDEYVSTSKDLKAVDEVVLIPPVSGG